MSCAGRSKASIRILAPRESRTKPANMEGSAIRGTSAATKAANRKNSNSSRRYKMGRTAAGICTAGRLSINLWDGHPCRHAVCRLECRGHGGRVCHHRPLPQILKFFHTFGRAPRILSCRRPALHVAEAHCLGSVVLPYLSHAMDSQRLLARLGVLALGRGFSCSIQ